MSIITPEEKEVFDTTNKHRMRIVELMTADGRYPLSDSEQLNLLLKTLNDADKNQLNQAKLKMAEKKEDDGKQNILLMTEILKGIRYDKDKAIVVEVPRELPALPEAVEDMKPFTESELELPKEMGEAESTYDQSDEGMDEGE